jgi:hypothetical protein
MKVSAKVKLGNYRDGERGRGYASEGSCPPHHESNVTHRNCSSISAAVALALPTTPGMPAPGCVPAPTT